MKKILITGAGSYVGEAVFDYLQKEPDKYSLKMLDTIGYKPEADDFRGYDVVVNVAGIAHIKQTEENRELYFSINRDLSVKIAKAAKSGGVKQLILMSTMSVYGKDVGHITKQTAVSPKNAYGLSKAQADEQIAKMSDDSFIFACLRPPMIYGKGCKGNYQKLRSFALKFPVFPDFDNQRSMIYIGNLCEFVKNVIDNESGGLFFPQNAEYVRTSDMVKKISQLNSKPERLTRLFNPAISLFKIGAVKKVFGTLAYEKTDLVDKYSFDESIELTEKCED